MKMLGDIQSPVYFVSPHYDDAILSAAGLLSYLSKRTKTVLINVFTRATPPPYSRSVRNMLQSLPHTDAIELFNCRKIEDDQAVNWLSISKYDLDFIDCLYRRKRLGWLQQKLFRFIPEMMMIYPVYRLHVIRGKTSPLDNELIIELKLRLKEIITEQDAIVFCPSGIGSHVDHFIVRNTCLHSFPSVIMWNDFPYCLSQLAKDFKNLSVSLFPLAPSVREEKENLIRMYKSQCRILFPKNVIPIIDEKYFSLNHTCRKQ